MDDEMLLLDVFNDDWLNEATVDSCAHDPHPLAASHATARLAELNAMERPPHNMTYVELHLMELEAESQSHDALGPIRSPSPAFTDWLMSEDDEPGCTTFHKTPGHSQLHSYNVSSQAHASVERSPTPLNGTTSPIPMDKASRAALLAEADTLPLRLPNLESLRIRSMIDDRANDQSPKKKARVKKPEMRVSATTIHASIQPAQYNNDAPSDVDGVAVDVDSLLGLQSNVASAPRKRSRKKRQATDERDSTSSNPPKREIAHASYTRPSLASRASNTAQSKPSALSDVTNDPTQAQMDAFFGFKPVGVPDSPSKDSVPASPSHPPMRGSRSTVLDKPASSSTRRSQRKLPKTQSDAARRGAATTASTSSASAHVLHLSPIPHFSPATHQPLTSDEKRLAIIDTLQRLALSLLSILLDVALDTADENDDNDIELRPIVIKLSNRRATHVDSTPHVESQQPLPTVPRSRRLVYPRICGDDAAPRFGGRELAAFLAVVEAIIDGLKNCIVSTKRDIFYRNVALFIRQQVVDTLIDDIAASLQVRRSDLNVAAASKGLFAGALRLTMMDDSVVGGGAQGALIPPRHDIHSVAVDGAEWVLVIEKEAVFQTLASGGFLSRSDVPRGIIITGKGYPDVSTRELVKWLSDELPSAPLLCLVDADPHGLDIYSTYSLGSSAQSFDRDNLAVPRLKWIGLKGTEWDVLGVDRDDLLLLTMADRKKAASMLKRKGLPDEWRRELEHMLHLGRKAEIQILSAHSSSQSQSQHGRRPQDSPLVSYLVRQINLACSGMLQ